MSLSKVQKAVATIPSGPGMWLKKTCCKLFFFVEKKEQKREAWEGRWSLIHCPGAGGEKERLTFPLFKEESYYHTFVSFTYQSSDYDFPWTKDSLTGQVQSY